MPSATPTAISSAVLLLAAALLADAAKRAEVGKPAPALILWCADGNHVPQESMDGKHLLVTFWSVASLKSTEGAAPCSSG